MKRGEYILFIFANFLYFFTFWMVIAYLPLLFHTYGFTDTQIGFVIGLNSLSSIILVFPLGVFSDRFSPKKIVIFGAICYSAYFLLLAVVKDFYFICAVVFLGGLGAASISIILISLYLKLIGENDRGKKVSVMHLGCYLGFGAGPLAGGYLYEIVGPITMFNCAFALSIVLLFVTLFLRDYPPVVFSFKGYRKDLKDPKALFLIAAVFILGTHFGVEQSSFSLLMKDNIGLRNTEIGIIFFALGLWMAVLVPFAGKVLDRRPKAFLFFALGLFVSSVFQILTAYTTTFTSLLIIRLIHTFGDMLAILEMDVLTSLVFPAKRLGGNSGILFCVRTSAIFLFAYLSGYLNDIGGYGVSFIVNGIMVLLFSLWALLLIRKGYFDTQES
ncbi:MAG: MFS transporter [Deltaproteobacteria bacterium]|nr:MFS transporter [Deltaproteobacteria bacterium]